jgi:hypothetical protein
MFARCVAAVLLVIAVGSSDFLGGQVQAQESRKQAIRSLESVLPQDANGTRIEESQLVWAYVAGVVGFLVAFGIAMFGVRVLAGLVIVICFLGGIALICFAVHEQVVKTWEQLAALIVGVGAVAGGISATAELYLLSGRTSKQSGGSPSS